MTRKDTRRTGRPAVSAADTLPDEALGSPPGKKSVLLKVLSAGLSGGLLVLLFLVIIPLLGSLDGVWAAISSMSATAVLVLFVGALVIRVLLAAAYSVLISALTFGRSLIAREASSAVSNVVPGPSGTATQYVILRSWGVGTESYASATISVGVTTDALVFAAPGGFLLLWLLLGMPASGGSDNLWWAGTIAVCLSVVTVVVVTAVARSERFAAALGRWGQAPVNLVRRRRGKPLVTDWPARSMGLRANTLDQLSDRALALCSCIGGGYLLNGFLIVGCLWACGVPREDMPMSLGLLLYSLGRIFTVVAITPGSVGVAEVVYTAVFVAVLGESSYDVVFAGVLVYRALTYALPLVTGAVSYLLWRVLRHREKPDEAESTPAAAPAE